MRWTSRLTLSGLVGLALLVPTAMVWGEEAQPARLRVRLPTDALLDIDGVPTAQKGTVRLFESPPLTQGKEYTYRLRATWGHETSDRQVRVTPGQEVEVDFRPRQASLQPASQPWDEWRPKYRRPGAVPYPKTNPYSVAKTELGKALFFDPRLSGSNWISCATCHNPALAWGDGLPRGVGHGMKQLGRRTPTLLNLAWSELYFWDGRADTLEEQALGPIATPEEMNQPLDDMVAKLRAIPGYQPLFEKAFPQAPISKETVAKALATYERTLISGPVPFDRWVEGDEGAISPAAKRGFTLFNTKANCAKCHSGWRFTDDSFHDIGVPGSDRGRGKYLEEIEVSQFAFKTPTLRNVDRRAPYLHDGCVPTLAEMIDMYNEGGKEKRPSLSREIKPLNLTQQEKADLLAFLKTLTSVDPPVTVPALPR